MNCWEFNKCGRQPGATMAEELGVCPVTIATFANGVNRGVNGGRICWGFHDRVENGIWHCSSCDFFNFIIKEEVV